MSNPAARIQFIQNRLNARLPAPHASGFTNSRSENGHRWQKIFSEKLPAGPQERRIGMSTRRTLTWKPPTAMKTSDLQLSLSRTGRILLHLKCIARSGRFHWHFQGIVRELTSSIQLWPAAMQRTPCHRLCSESFKDQCLHRWPEPDGLPQGDHIRRRTGRGWRY